ncbi:hypothetical protein BO068_005117 [Escherichia coli]|nr:hypothetical protein [Escherichia coli]
MFGKLKIAALSALIAAGSLAAIPSSANAGQIDVDVYLGGGYMPAGHNGYNNGYYVGPRGGGYYGGGYYNGGYNAPKCSPRKAESKARYMGLGRTFVASVGSREIVVKGRKYGRTHTVVFGRSASCPIRASW